MSRMLERENPEETDQRAEADAERRDRGDAGSSADTQAEYHPRTERPDTDPDTDPDQDTDPDAEADATG